MVYSLYRSDLLVLAIPFQAWTGPIFSYLWNPFPTSYTDFRLGIPRFRVLGYFFLPLESLSDLLHGFSFGDSQISGTWTHFRPQAPHYQLELHHWTTVLQGPQVMIVTDNTAVSVFPQQGGINPHTPSCPVVVFYSIASISPVTVNHPLTTEWSFNPEIVPGLFRSWDTPTVDMLATVHNTPLSQFRFPIQNLWYWR